MVYADIQDAIDLYGEEYVTTSFDRDNDGEIDTAAAELMLSVVSAEADSYMVGRVDPIQDEADIPLDLMMRVIDIAIYRMCPDAARLTKEKSERFTAAIDWFKMVARGEINLTKAGVKVAGNKVAGPSVSTAVEALQSQRDNARWFKRSSLKEIL